MGPRLGKIPPLIRTSENRTVALGGLFQAARLVQESAHFGTINPTAFAASIHSIFQIDAADVADVYDGVEGVRLGLEQLQRQIRDGKETRNVEIAKYVVALLYLERKLHRNPAMRQRIRAGIERAAQQAEHFSPTHSNVIASLANCYLQTVSTLKPRILVNGEHLHLSNPDNASRIRSLLLAGIRAAVLWRQCGGTRLQLVFGQRALAHAATRLLAGLETRAFPH